MDHRGLAFVVLSSIWGCGGPSRPVVEAPPAAANERSATPESTGDPPGPCAAYADLDEVCAAWVADLREGGQDADVSSCQENALFTGDAGGITRVVQLTLPGEESSWWSLLALEAGSRWYVLESRDAYVSPGAHDGGLFMQAHAEAGGVALAAETNSEDSEGASENQTFWLVSFAHGAPRLRFAAVALSTEVAEGDPPSGSSWRLPVVWVDADHVAVGPSEYEEEEGGGFDDPPEPVPAREERTLPDCASTPDACPAQCGYDILPTSL